METRSYDLLVIGGGINGAGIARDAAGRGLSVLLVEKDDLAAHTSSASTKLIHGGLRYLEHYEFRLVAEALAEREVLLHVAPHIIEPLLFVLPHEPHLRPSWMIRAGLFLYDRLGGRMTLPKSFSVRLAGTRYGTGLKPRFRKGFVYADARVDDARLVVCNALDARARGSDIRVRTKLVAARRDNGLWHATLVDDAGARSDVTARALVNAAGPWVRDVLGELSEVPIAAGVRHVKGSHIVVPRIHDAPHAYILQNADNRIVFVIPYQDAFSLIGTTDVPVEHYAHPVISDEETYYLLTLANTYVERPLAASDIVWSYSGVRPLYDDGTSDPSAITRDYVLQLDAGRDAANAPVLSIFGGKITTYRKLAEAALAELRPFFPAMGPSWTHAAPLPGGDLPGGDRDAWLAELRQRYPALPAHLLRALARRHGTRALAVLADTRSPADLGEDFGAELTEREIRYLQRDEWAVTADDVLWRRTKCGLAMTGAARARVAEFLGR
jgi:D-erythritol 1-phosphate dehydrogenase